MSSSQTVDPIHVVDTHALVWHLTDQSKLGARARAIFASAERGETRLVVSAIVTAELFYLWAKRGAAGDFARLMADLGSRPYIRFVPFLPRHTLDFVRDAAVPEMHDRIIAGLARRLGCPLITKDGSIRASGLVPVVW